MNPDVLVIKHNAFDGLGLIERVLAEHEIGYDKTELTQGAAILNPMNYQAVIVLGGAGSANAVSATSADELAKLAVVVRQNIPCLAIGLGMHMLVRAASGSVVASPRPEIGFMASPRDPFVVNLTDAGKQDALFAGLSGRLDVFQLHGEMIAPWPTMQVLATDGLGQNQIVKVGERAYGLQPHFEITEPVLRDLIGQYAELRALGTDQLLAAFARVRGTYTVAGLTLFRNFLGIAGLV